MKVKRYEGKSEAALMPIIHEEMGPGATIISIKEKPAKGLFAFFKKPTVVITAAYEEDDDFMSFIANSPENDPPALNASITAPNSNYATSKLAELPGLSSDLSGVDSDSDAGLEASMSLLLQEARKAANQIEHDEAVKREMKRALKEKPVSHGTHQEGRYKHSMVQMFYDSMIAQQVLPNVAALILRNLESIDETNHVDVKLLIKSVYGTIVDILKDPTLINTEKNGIPQTIVFMGPTGVGKTTTIAKLSSVLTLKHDMKVGLITADTYRIAAVEQLKTYADILGLDIRVAYKLEEVESHLKALKPKCDIVLIDTAGRSHKNPETVKELEALLAIVPESKRYLVLSITTRYEDLCKIVNVYDQQTDFDIIFTKLDEAETLGSLMNICCIAGKKAAYVTFGQNVPDDLEAVTPDKIAKSLLGLDSGNLQPYAEGGSAS